MIYRPKYFKEHEYIYPELYEKHKKDGTIWKLPQAMDKDVLITNDNIREFVNTSVTINNYAWGGVFSESGLRHADSETGSDLSTHKYGKASDLKFNSADWTPEKLREHMKKIGCFEPGFKLRRDLEAAPFLLINRIEWAKDVEMTWFHHDTSALGNNDGSIAIIWVNLNG